MSVATVFGICASFLVGIGLYGMIVQPHPLRKMLSFNVLGAGTFLLFGAIARRGAEAGLGGESSAAGSCYYRHGGFVFCDGVGNRDSAPVL